MDNSPADSSNNSQAPSQPPVNENITKPIEQPAQNIPNPEPVKATVPPNPIVSTPQSFVNPVNTNSNSGYNFKIILPILIILIIVFFGIFYIINSSSEKSNTLSQVPKTTNTVTTLPTPTPQQVTPTISSPASNDQLDTEIQTLDSEITNLDSNITNIDNGLNDRQTNLN